jgi:beta-mannosidase
MRTSLDSETWQLTFSTAVDAPATDLKDAISKGYTQIPATVPGTVEQALENAGLMPNPLIGTNVEAAWALEYGDWWYSRNFDVDSLQAKDKTVLMLHGVDTIADVYLNGQLVGQTDNMLIEHELSVDDALRHGNNEIVIHITSPLAHAESMDYPAEYTQVEGSLESLWVRKPAHMYGWDIAPRIVSAGIHRSIELVSRPSVHIKEWWLQTLSTGQSGSPAELQLHFLLSESPRGRDVNLSVSLLAPDGITQLDVGLTPSFLAGVVPISVENPQFWNPRGYGKPNLYQATIELSLAGKAVDTHQGRHGIRSITLEHQQGTDSSSNFEFFVNNRSIMILGTNWVQLDPLHSRDKERMPEALALLWESGVNTVRCWGGNLYEDTHFFDWCDENGILVWQDFALACARYPQTDPFVSTLETEAVSIVKKLRGHASLAIWCGSNENDDMYVNANLNPDMDVLTRDLLPKVIHRHDPYRAYIAGSPTYTGEMLNSNDLNPPEQHLWGDRASFKASFYSDTSAQFVSEVGFQGLPNVKTLRRFLPDLTDHVLIEDVAWRYHESHQRRELPKRAYNRNQLLLNQASLLFGEIGTELNAVVPASQISQAEAKKFFVESCRLGGRELNGRADLSKPSRTGVVWWNLLDCWPQVSDAIVDYYFEKKLAFHYLRNSQQATCIMVAEAKGWSHEVVLVNDSDWFGDIQYTVTALGASGPALRGSIKCGPGRRMMVLGQLPLAVNRATCYLIEWTTELGKGMNHYVASNPPYDLRTYVHSFLPAIAALDTTIDVSKLWATS